MTAAKRFTPGPWQAVEVVGGLPCVVATGTHEVVAERVFNGNQHLIAAAPDLLAACEAAMAHILEVEAVMGAFISKDPNVTLMKFKQVVADALRKAKGGAA